MKTPWLAVLVAALLPIGAAAAVRAEFSTVLTSPSYSYGGVLTVDRDRSRIDFTSGNHPLFNENTSVITREGGLDIILIDHSTKTWSQRASAGLGGHLSTTRGLGRETTASKATVRTERDGSEHRLFASYSIVMTIEGERLPATVEMKVVSELEGTRQQAFPWGMHFGAKTGFEEIDRVIGRRMPLRLPSRQIVTASRQIEGGPVVTETITTTITKPTETQIDDTFFFPPAGYKYQVPVFEFDK